MLVEKAYAKLQGSYYNCRLGSPLEGLMDLTGAPTIRIKLSDPTFSFDDLWSWDRNGCIVCASTPGVDTFTEVTLASMEPKEPTRGRQGALA